MWHIASGYQLTSLKLIHLNRLFLKAVSQTTSAKCQQRSVSLYAASDR